MRYLRLNVDFSVERRTRVDTAVVNDLFRGIAFFDLAKAPLDVKHAVAELFVVEQHLLRADAFDDERLSVGPHRPHGFLSEWLDGHTAPSGEIGLRHQVLVLRAALAKCGGEHDRYEEARLFLNRKGEGRKIFWVG